jgi:hypothetical protein
LRQWPDLDSTDVKVYAPGCTAVYARLAVALAPERVVLETVESLHSFGEFLDTRYYDSHNVKSFVIPGIALHEHLLRD